MELRVTISGHERREPHLKIETGERVAHYQCAQCGRDIVMVGSPLRGTPFCTLLSSLGQ
jgi:hypothetical protein